MKISYISLGCAKNQVDFEYLIGELSSLNFEIELDPSLCDAVIINTCGFIADAVKEAIENILLMSETIPDNAKLIVTGCMAERYKDEILKEIPEIDFITGVGKLSEVTAYLSKIENIKKQPIKNKRVITNVPYFAYVKISEGCDSKCSFCTIPSIRGKLKSIALNDIVKEVASLINDGVKEIILISQDTARYHYDIDKKIKLIDLLDALTTKFKDTYFRLLYLNPEGVDKKLISFIKSKPNIIKYFDIPMQHASDKVLKLMRRRSDRKTIDKIINDIRTEIPEAIIRSTFIVGHPGEDEADFNELVNFLEMKKIDFAGFFAYSDEDGTHSYKLADKVDIKTIKKRKTILEKLQKRITTDKLKSLKHKNILCFIEGVSDVSDILLEGRALFQSPDIDGKVYLIDGVADNGYGPYNCEIKRVIYPDIYVKIK